MARIQLVSGGQRSGKSSWAQEQALAAAGARQERPLYLATARVLDDELRQRVDRHQSDRAGRWDTIESPGRIDHPQLAGRVAVIDCLTLWLAELCGQLGYRTEPVMAEVEKQLAALENIDCRLYMVTNEINMGLHGLDRDTRIFQDIQGWTNQKAARLAESLVLMVSGYPLWVKQQGKAGHNGN